MGIEEPPLNNFCCCCPLHGGLLVSSYITLVTNVFLLLAVIWGIVYLPGARSSPVFYGALVSLPLDMLFAITFIMGLHKRRVKLIQVFYVYSIVAVTLLILLVLFIVIILVIAGTLVGFANIQFPNNVTLGLIIFMILLGAGVAIGLKIYHIIMVKSMIVELRNRNFQERNPSLKSTDPDCPQLSPVTPQFLMYSQLPWATE